MNQYLQKFSSIVSGLIPRGKPSIAQKSSFSSSRFSRSEEEKEKDIVERHRTFNELMSEPSSVFTEAEISKARKTLSGEFETGEDEQIHTLENHRDGITSIINVLGKAGYTFERTRKVNDPNDIIGEVPDADLENFWKTFDEADF
jgi:hypothetical protein